MIKWLSDFHASQILLPAAHHTNQSRFHGALVWRHQVAHSDGSCIAIFIVHAHAHTHVHKYSGYWHGSVHVHMRTAREVQDFDYFLEEVATLSCIRHENIQLFMGVCLDMTGGTLAIMMRCVMLLLVLSVPPDLCTHWIVHSQKLNLGNKSMADCTPILLYKVTDVYL